MTTCLGIRNATHWADARSIERISCINYFNLVFAVDVSYDLFLDAVVSTL